MQEEFGDEGEKALRTAGQRMTHAARKQGVEQGLKQGLEQGLEQGRLQQVDLLLAMLVQRFGPLAGGTRIRIQDADAVQLARWSKRMLAANDLEQVFSEQ